MSARPDLGNWRTSITLVEPGSIAYRGIAIERVIDSMSFPAVVWLLLAGREPTAAQEDAIRRVLVAACDHGLAAPAIATARTCASTRGAPGAAVAAGLLAFAGPAHGGAAGACAALLCEIGGLPSESEPSAEQITTAVGERLDAGRRLPGFGHPYHPRDPRVPGLLGCDLPQTRYRRLVAEVERALVAARGERLRMNADAAVAALLLDAGLDGSATDLVTSIGRTVGLSAHVHEERTAEAPFRAPALESIDYAGPAAEAAEVGR